MQLSRPIAPFFHRLVLISASLIGLALVRGGSIAAEDPALAAGEFSVAKSLQKADRDAWLGQIASSQSMSGEAAAALGTLGEIGSAKARRTAVDQSRGAVAGGGAFADFDSLMQLIETTVAPDTWESLGGNSTMAPYPQGVFVDPKGTVREAVTVESGESLENLSRLLSTNKDSAIGDWRSPSNLRCVSLRRLRDEITQRRISGRPLGDMLLNMAGLSRIQYLMFTEDDILVAAPVGGIDLDRGWFIDQESGRTTLRTDFLARCFASKLSGAAFGCTIDPTPEGMAAAAEVAQRIRGGNLSIGLAAEKLQDALGMQRVEVFGTAGDSAVSLLMVEADRHMKQLALGEQPMPDGVDNYLDAVDQFIDQGPPDGLLLRLWFTANQQSVRRDADGKVFEIAGAPIRLSGQNQRALADGGRGAVTVEPRSQRFVEVFNRNWNRIRDKYPVYGALESLYRVAAVAELVERQSDNPAHRSLAESIAMDDESRDWYIVAPKQVESIAKLHTVRKGKKRHHVLLASGGVAVQLASTVKGQMTVYPTLPSVDSVTDDAPIAVNRWWWDVR